MSLTFFYKITSIIIGYFFVNLIHEIFHLIAFKVIGLNLYYFEAYPINIYKRSNRNKIKINMNLKNFSQAFILPEVSTVIDKIELEKTKNKIIFSVLAGPIGSLIFGIILKNILCISYSNNMFLNIVAILSMLLGVLTFLFSDGLMVWRMCREKTFMIFTLFYYNSLLLNEELLSSPDKLFLYNYANQECKEINMRDKLFYTLPSNKDQINLQKQILYYALVHDIEIYNIDIINNMKKFIEILPEIKSLNGFLFEYVNVITIYLILKENDTEEAKKVFQFIRNISFRKSTFQKYIIDRTKFFLGEISKEDVLNALYKVPFINFKNEILLFNQNEKIIN